MTPQLTVATLAQAIGVAFALGALLLVVLTFLPPTRTVAKQLWPILASEAAILAAGVIPWLLPSTVFLAILLAAAARIGFESGSVHGLTAGRDFRLSHAALAVAVSASAWASPTVPFLWAAGTLLVVGLIGIALNSGNSTPGSLARFLVFPLLPLAAFSHAASQPQLAPLLLLAFFLVEMFDSFSLLGGKLYGRTPLVPRLSPRKTWEGLGTGVAAVVATLLALIAWVGLPVLPMFSAGAVAVAAAIVGDLLGSLAKRRAGVKDYPPIMQVQGGLLDIADAWLAVGPSLTAMGVLMAWL